MEEINFEVLRNNIASFGACVLFFGLICYLLIEIVLVIKTARLQKEFIEKLDDHDKAVILDYKQQTALRQLGKKKNNGKDAMK